MIDDVGLRSKSSVGKHLGPQIIGHVNARFDIPYSLFDPRGKGNILIEGSVIARVFNSNLARFSS